MHTGLSRAAFLAGAGAAALIPLRAGADTPAVRIGVGFADSMAEGIYAQKRNAFRDAGINAEIIELGSGGALIAAVAGGACDISVANTVSIAVAIARGAPIRLIAGGALYSSSAPTQALCVANDSAIRTAKDLEGRIVAVTSLKDLTEVGCRAWIDQHGGDATKVRFTEIGMGAMLPAAQRGTVDGVFIGEPYLSASKKLGLRILGNAYDAIAPQFLLSSWCTSQSFYDKNAALVRRVVDVIYDTARWANVHHDESAAMYAEATKGDIAVISSSTRMRYATSLDIKMIQPILTQMQKYSAFDKPIVAADLIGK